MTDFDTLTAVTDNLQTVLKGLGLNFTRQTFDDETQIPASLLPLGQIFFKSVEFENTHNERPSYAEAIFDVKVIQSHKAPETAIRDQQKWITSIRDGVTIGALNIGSLVSSKLVSRVTNEGSAEMDNKGSGMSFLTYPLRVRYREQ